MNLLSPKTNGTISEITLLRPQWWLLARYDDTPPNDFIFSPKRTIRERYERLAAQRKSKRQPSQVKRSENSKRPEDRVGDMYTRYSYKNAIQRAALKAGVPHWTPYQIRHSLATEIEQKFGKRAASAFLGHTNTKTTETYIDRNLKLIAKISRKLDAKDTVGVKRTGGVTSIEITILNFNIRIHFIEVCGCCLSDVDAS